MNSTIGFSTRALIDLSLTAHDRYLSFSTCTVYVIRHHLHTHTHTITLSLVPGYC